MVLTALFVFEQNSNVVHVQIQEYNLAFNPQNSSVYIHASLPLPAQAIPRWKGVGHKPLFWGAQILIWPQEKHDNLWASMITFYTLFMDVQT